VTTVLVTHDQEEALDVADRIALLHRGRIEQVGTPDDLYDRPANEFVMSFLGSVSRLSGDLVRPHDIVLERRPGGGSDHLTSRVRAVVTRVVRLGFEVRVELRGVEDDQEFSAQLTRGDIDALALRDGDMVWARSTRTPALPRSTAGVAVP
jgi:sulfate transport system ATP-binding protein